MISRECHKELIKYMEDKLKQERENRIMSIQPREHLLNVEICSSRGTSTRVGTTLPLDLREKLIWLLKENTDIFVSSSHKLQGIAPIAMEHLLNVDKGKRSIT